MKLRLHNFTQVYLDFSLRQKGPSGTWKKRVRKLPTIIHVDKPQIDKNRKHEIAEPVITVKRGNSYNKKAHVVEIKGSCRVVYHPEKPLLNCHAVVWIEVEPDTEVIPKKLTPYKICRSK